jgi:hypothetical protein
MTGHNRGAANKIELRFAGAPGRSSTCKTLLRNEMRRIDDLG